MALADWYDDLVKLVLIVILLSIVWLDKKLSEKKKRQDLEHKRKQSIKKKISSKH